MAFSTVISSSPHLYLPKRHPNLQRTIRCSSSSSSIARPSTTQFDPSDLLDDPNCRNQPEARRSDSSKVPRTDL
ncbi:hypothetical protein L1049_015522 [Liquidambar formosana]|uniref:Uncharacterized protein n=1 Tax=Liquidambar formosana TaxID=63359 RepID=A0AAP0X2K8_LIQFO